MDLFELALWGFSSKIYPGVEFLGHTAVLFLLFCENSILCSTVATPISIPTNSGQGLPFVHTLTLVIHVLFGGSHSDRDEVISYCGFDLHFPRE